MPKGKKLKILELGAQPATVRSYLINRHPNTAIEYHGVSRIPYLQLKDSLQQPNVEVNLHAQDVESFLKDERRAKTGYFDEVHLHMLDRKSNLLAYAKQLFRVLKRGGLLYAVEETQNNYHQLSSEIDRHSLGVTLATSMGTLYSGRIRPTKEPELEPSQLKRITEENRQVAELLRKTGFEILRVSLHDAKVPGGKPVEIPPGILPEKGRQFPKRSAARLVNQLTSYPSFATQFLILRKPR